MAVNKSAVKKIDMLDAKVLDAQLPTSVNVGGHKVEMRFFRENAGHDDSMPYQAKVYVDGKECAVAYNDGWGGETNIATTKTEAYPLLNEVDKYIRDHSEEFPMGEYMGVKLNHESLASICDMLAENCANRKDATKYADVALIVYNPDTHVLSRIGFTKPSTVKLSELVGEHRFKTLWYDTIAKYEDKGYVILSVKDIFGLLRKAA